jgi:DNA ligase-associated metallophosphoesterase
MNIIEREIRFGGVELTLTNQRAILWKEQEMLILSDLHLGKAAHFRKNGIALPSEVALGDLQRLEHLITHFNAKKVVVVGDLIHASSNSEVVNFKKITSDFNDTKFILIKGNHDRISEKEVQNLGIDQVFTTFRINEIAFSHQPIEDSNYFQITGHIHPGVRIRMLSKQYLRLPCFSVSEQLIILPAFSSFTGLDTGFTSEKSVNYAFSEEGIFEIR